jgi:uncharacterized membrane protein (DUF373 family)
MENQKKIPPKNRERIGKTSFFNPLDLSMGFFFCIFAFNFLLEKGAWQMKRLFKQIGEITKDANFMHLIEHIEVIVSKVLSIAMVLVILVAIGDLIIFISKELFTTDYGAFNQVLFKVFGLFLNILIALEILENITGYLKKHVLQVELVIVTSLIAIARKIIILDLKATEGIEIIGLGIAVLSLSISYLIIKLSNARNPR